MKCIFCNESKNGIKLYNGNPLCDNCLGLQKQIIKDKLYLGNYDYALNKELLKEKNISCVLVCGSELTCEYKEMFKYLKIDLNDYIEDSLLPYIDKCIQFINENQDKKIFVHCNAGISRSPSIVIAYLIKALNYSFKDAYNLVKSKRNIKPNEKFIQELQSLEQKK